MNTLREIMRFVGLDHQNPVSDLPPGSFLPPMSMRTVGNRVHLLSREARTSMRAMIVELQNLPPISLRAEVIGPRQGEEPFIATVRVHPSDGGVVLKTYIHVLLHPVGGWREGESYVQSYENVGVSGGVKDIRIQLSPGHWTLDVTRLGVTNTGITELHEHLGAWVYTKPRPSQPPPPQTPQTPQTTFIQAHMRLDPEATTLSGQILSVGGYGFEAGEDVTLKFTYRPDQTATASTSRYERKTTANELGAIGFEEHQNCGSDVSKRPSWQVQATGDTSGRKSNVTGASCY